MKNQRIAPTVTNLIKQLLELPQDSLVRLRVLDANDQYDGYTEFLDLDYGTGSKGYTEFLDLDYGIDSEDYTDKKYEGTSLFGKKYVTITVW